jgi:hypothetical protein
MLHHMQASQEGFHIKWDFTSNGHKVYEPEYSLFALVRNFTGIIMLFVI